MRLAIVAIAWLVLSCASAYPQSVGLSGGKGRGAWVINPSVPSIGSYPFINLFKLCGGLGQAPNFNLLSWINSQGYPIAGLPNQIACDIYTPQSYSGAYVLKWTGTFGSGGVAGVSIAAQFVGNTYTIDSDPGSCVHSNSGGTITFVGTNCTVEFTPATPLANVLFSFLNSGTIANITSIEFYQKRWEPEHQAGELFDPDYLAFLRELNPRILRFLGWSNSFNQDTRSRYSALTPLNAATYASDRYDVNAISASTSYDSGSETYSASAPPNWAGLVDGAFVHLYTTDDNVGTATKLNVGGTGAKTVKDFYYFDIAAGGIGGDTTRVNTFVYDAITQTWIRRTPGFQEQVSLEAQVALCNKLAKDCWFVVPYKFDDASFATYGAYIRDNLNPSLNAHFEYSNEIGTGFSSTQWAGAQAVSRGYVDVGFSIPMVGIFSLQGWGHRRMMEQICGSDASTCATWTANGRSRSTLKGMAMALVFQNTTTLPRLRYNGDYIIFDAAGLWTTGPNNAEVVGTVSGTTLTVTSVNSGVVRAGMPISGTGLAGGTRVESRLTGTGGTGTYNLTASASLSSRTFTLTPGGTGEAIVTDYSQAPNRPRDYMHYSSFANYITSPNLYGGGGLADPLSSTVRTITDISNAATGVVTSAGHGYSNGDRVLLTVTGMSELNLAWTTVSEVTADTFKLSNTFNYGGTSAISANTSGYGTFSAGTMTRLIPGNNTAVLAAADDLASGDPVRVASAMNYVSNDFLAGTRYDSNGVLQTWRASAANFTSSSAALLSWPNWRDAVSGPSAMNLPWIGYEGYPEFFYFTSAHMNQIGVDTAYANKLNALIANWKLSDQSRMVSNAFLQSSLNYEGNLYPAGLMDAFLGTYQGGITASISGTTLTVTATSFEIIVGSAIITGATPGTTIVQQLTGTNGSTGTYRLDRNLGTIGSGTIVLFLASPWAIVTGDIYSTRYGVFRAFSNFGAAP